MREKNSERPDTRDNRSKNSTKTGKKKKNTKKILTYFYRTYSLLIRRNDSAKERYFKNCDKTNDRTIYFRRNAYFIY